MEGAAPERSVDAAIIKLLMIGPDSGCANYIHASLKAVLQPRMQSDTDTPAEVQETVWDFRNAAAGLGSATY